MARYRANVVATSAVTTPETWIEIDAPANTSIFISRINVYHTDGTQTGLSERTLQLALTETSTAATGGISFTPVDYDANATPSTSTVTIKNAANTCTPGTITTTFDTTSFYRYHNFEFLARDFNDMISITPGGRFAIQIATSNTGVALTLRVSWME